MADLVDTIVADTGYPQDVVSALVALSFPIRSSMITFLNTAKAFLIASTASIIGTVAKADVIAQELATVSNAGRVALAPFDTFLGMIPFKQLAEASPNVVGQLQNIFGNTPVIIPDNLLTEILDINKFDVFAGVTNYQSLKTKLNELEFRTQRAVTLASRASALSTNVHQAIATIDMYLDIFTRMQ